MLAVMQAPAGLRTFCPVVIDAGADLAATRCRPTGADVDSVNPEAKRQRVAATPTLDVNMALAYGSVPFLGPAAANNPLQWLSAPSDLRFPHPQIHLSAGASPQGMGLFGSFGAPQAGPTGLTSSWFPTQTVAMHPATVPFSMPPVQPDVTTATSVSLPTTVPAATYGGPLCLALPASSVVPVGPSTSALSRSIGFTTPAALGLPILPPSLTTLRPEAANAYVRRDRTFVRRPRVCSKSYRCSKCNQVKKGHICGVTGQPSAVSRERASSDRGAAADKSAPASPASAAVQSEPPLTPRVAAGTVSVPAPAGAAAASVV